MELTDNPAGYFAHQDWAQTPVYTGTYVVPAHGTQPAPLLGAAYSRAGKLYERGIGTTKNFPEPVHPEG